ncbi:MAG: hypothetical protein WBX38_13615 [Candidatus Sulfotelmatobacter sp.]
MKLITPLLDEKTAITVVQMTQVLSSTSGLRDYPLDPERVIHLHASGAELGKRPINTNQ